VLRRGLLPPGTRTPFAALSVHGVERAGDAHLARGTRRATVPDSEAAIAGLLDRWAAAGAASCKSRPDPGSHVLDFTAESIRKIRTLRHIWEP
jgi:hypothetical protein